MPYSLTIIEKYICVYLNVYVSVYEYLSTLISNPHVLTRNDNLRIRSCSIFVLFITRKPVENFISSLQFDILLIANRKISRKKHRQLSTRTNMFLFNFLIPLNFFLFAPFLFSFFTYVTKTFTLALRFD